MISTVANWPAGPVRDAWERGLRRPLPPLQRMSCYHKPRMTTWRPAKHPAIPGWEV